MGCITACKILNYCTSCTCVHYLRYVWSEKKDHFMLNAKFDSLVLSMSRHKGISYSYRLGVKEIWQQTNWFPRTQPEREVCLHCHNSLTTTSLSLTIIIFTTGKTIWLATDTLCTLAMATYSNHIALRWRKEVSALTPSILSAWDMRVDWLRYYGYTPPFDQTTSLCSEWLPPVCANEPLPCQRLLILQVRNSFRPS